MRVLPRCLWGFEERSHFLRGRVRLGGLLGARIGDGSLVVALRLGVVAKEERKRVGLLGDRSEAGGDGQVVALAGGDCDAVVEVVAKVLVAEGPAGLVEGVGEEAGF